MTGLASQFMLGSAAVIGLLGAIHLLYTFRGDKLHPRDPALRARMEAVSPVLTRETTMWKTWIGFNASHSCSALLFALVYGYLALAQPRVLFGSAFLQLLGLAFLGFFAYLGRVYWFRIPFRGIVVSGALFLAAIVVARI
jgi:hypothetical protein